MLILNKSARTKNIILQNIYFYDQNKKLNSLNKKNDRSSL